jgi:hypothetical protein
VWQLVSVNRINASAALPEKVDAVIAEDPLAQSKCNNKVSSKRSGDLNAQDHVSFSILGQNVEKDFPCIPLFRCASFFNVENGMIHSFTN